MWLVRYKASSVENSAAWHRNCVSLCEQPGWEERVHHDGRIFYIDHSKWQLGCEPDYVVCSSFLLSAFIALMLLVG